MPIARRLTFGLLILLTLSAIAVRCDDASATQPSVSLGDGRFQFTPPPADQWEAVEQENTGVVVYRTKKKDALIAIQLLPGGMEINDDVTGALLKELREAHEEKHEKVLLEPTVEKDDDLALKVHERYVHRRKTADRIHMYRLVGKRMALAVVNSKGQSEEQTSAAHAAAKQALLSVTGPLNNAKRTAATATAAATAASATKPATNPERKSD